MHFDPALPATTQVSLQFDRRIPPHMWDVAVAIDRARKHTISHLRPGRITLKPGAIVERMAAAIIEAWGRRGEVHELDFRRAGITPAQMATHRDRAFALACLREPRVDAMREEAAA